jgi:hypothetical protein
MPVFAVPVFAVPESAAPVFAVPESAMPVFALPVLFALPVFCDPVLLLFADDLVAGDPGMPALQTYPDSENCPTSASVVFPPTVCPVSPFPLGKT